MYQLNDLTTKDDHDFRQYYPKSQADDGMCRRFSHDDIGHYRASIYVYKFGQNYKHGGCLTSCMYSLLMIHVASLKQLLSRDHWLVWNDIYVVCDIVL